MKKIIIAIVVLIAFMSFTGCKQAQIEAKQYADNNNLQPFVSYLCLGYPFFPTGECTNLMEINVLYGTTKACFGFDTLKESPAGMECLTYDIIEK